MSLAALIDGQDISADLLVAQLRTTKRELGETIGVAPRIPLTQIAPVIAEHSDATSSSGRDPQHGIGPVRQSDDGLCLVSL